MRNFNFNEIKQSPSNTMFCVCVCACMCVCMCVCVCVCACALPPYDLKKKVTGKERKRADTQYWLSPSNVSKISLKLTADKQTKSMNIDTGSLVIL